MAASCLDIMTTVLVGRGKGWKCVVISLPFLKALLEILLRIILIISLWPELGQMVTFKYKSSSED